MTIEKAKQELGGFLLQAKIQGIGSEFVVPSKGNGLMHIDYSRILFDRNDLLSKLDED